jgi:hypothetical protein
MKKTFAIILIFLLPNMVLFGQTKADKTEKQSSKKKTPQYHPLFLGIDVMQQLSQSNVVGSPAISSAQKAFANVGIYGGYQHDEHQFELGFSLGNCYNGWRYANSRLNVEVNPNINRATINTRLGYNYTFFSLGRRVEMSAGAGLTWINLINRDTVINYTAESFDKIISGVSERLLKDNSFGFDGKIQLNYILTPHLDVHIFTQYRHAPTVLRSANVAYFDAITGIKQDVAIVNSVQSAFIFGIGLQYNLRPSYKKHVKETEEKKQ